MLIKQIQDIDKEWFIVVYFLVNGKVLSDLRPKADESSLIIPE